MSSINHLLIYIILAVLALALNVWWLIPLLALLCGYTSSNSLKSSALFSFLGVGVTWAVALYIRDGMFHRSPSDLFGAVAGGLPGWAVPLIAGLLGGVVAMLAAMSGQLLSSKKSNS